MATQGMGPTGSTVTGAPPPVGTPAGTPPTSDQTSAKAILDSFFGSTGLQALAGKAWQMILQGDSAEQVMEWVRSSQEYANRFRAMKELNARGQGIDEATYMSYERNIYSLVQANGLPKGMYDTPEAIEKMLLNNVSVSEAQDRMKSAVYAAYTAPASVRQAMQDQWGASWGDMIAGYLDTDKALPLIQQQFAAAQIGGAAIDQGLQLRKDTAVGLASRGLGYDQALQGFAQVANDQALTSGFGETTNQDTQIAGVFGDAGAARTVQRVRRGRIISQRGSGGFAESQTGVLGLGSSTS